MNRDPKLSPQRATSPGILRLYNDIKNDFAPITSKANTIRSDKVHQHWLIHNQN